MLPHQLKRIVRRVPIGISRVGGYGGNSSGDIFIAFSTANPGVSDVKGVNNIEMISNDNMSELFEATADATEESILNALIAAEDMTGKNNTKVFALPEGRLVEVLKKYNRIK
jgi:D-aminopeptidase